MLSLIRELTLAIRNGLKRSATKLVGKEEDLAKLEKQLDEVEEAAELTEDFGGKRQKRKTNGNPEDQLSPTGRNKPPLTLKEIQKVLKWQNFRNTPRCRTIVSCGFFFLKLNSL